MSGNAVSVLVDGVRTVHLPDWSGNYATLCALDGDDPALNQTKTENDVGSIIDCTACTRIWQICLAYPPRAFAKP